jgi:glycosyltransferase involved in cell wall biosynthesis
MIKLEETIMNKVLTIVVPSYNVENFLPECIPPYVKPVCDERLEVIIVNDGSKDRTQEIAEEFVSKYPSVIKVINKKNGGHGSTINVGLKVATGKYFKVIDGDDYVDNSELIRFLDFLERSEEDVITNDKVNFIDGNKPNNEERLTFGPVGYDTHLSMGDITPEWNYTMHRITIKTSVIQNIMPEIDENCFYVDQELIIYSLGYVESLRASDAIMYYYRLGNANQSVAPANAYKRRENLYTVINSILNFYFMRKSEIKFPHVTSYMEQAIATQINRYATICLANLKSTEQDFVSVHELEERVKAEFPQIYNKIPQNKYYNLAKSMPHVLYRLFIRCYMNMKKQ